MQLNFTNAIFCLEASHFNSSVCDYKTFFKQFSYHLSKSPLHVHRAIRQQLLEANLPRIEPGPEAARLFLSDKELSTAGQKELARLHFELDKKRSDSKTQNPSEKDLFESEGKKPIQEMRRQVTIGKHFNTQITFPRNYWLGQRLFAFIRKLSPTKSWLICSVVQSLRIQSYLQYKLLYVHEYKVLSKNIHTVPVHKFVIQIVFDIFKIIKEDIDTESLAEWCLVAEV